MQNINYVNLYDFVKKHIEFIEIIKIKYLKLLENLTTVEFISNEMFIERLDKIYKSNSLIIIAFVGNITKNLIDLDSFNIVGSGTIYIEPKFARGGKSVGHIEDIVVDNIYRGQGIAQTILNDLKNYGKKLDCYKVILDCNNNLTSFYIKNDFEIKGVQMGKYFE